MEEQARLDRVEIDQANRPVGIGGEQEIGGLGITMDHLVAQPVPGLFKDGCTRAQLFNQAATKGFPFVLLPGLVSDEVEVFQIPGGDMEIRERIDNCKGVDVGGLHGGRLSPPWRAGQPGAG